MGFVSRCNGDGKGLQGGCYVGVESHLSEIKIVMFCALVFKRGFSDDRILVRGF